MKWPWQRRDEDLGEEIRAHIEMSARDREERGEAAGDARAAARREFGNAMLVKETTRDMWGWASLERIWQDVRYGLRAMRRNPGFTAVVILTLALGIGANSAVFSAIDAVILRPLAFPDGDQLMKIYQFNPKVKSPQTFVAPIRLEDWNRMNSTFQAITGYYMQDDSETSGTLPEEVTQALVAPRFLQVWGIAPELGRDFNSDEERFGGPNAILISDRFWRRRFGGDPSVLGKKLRLNGFSCSIVGVMPASFLFPERNVDLWSPVPLDAPFAQSRDATWYFAVGRLRPGVTLAQARADLATVQAQLGRAFPKPDADLNVGIEPLREITVGGVRSSLWILFGSVSLLLLITCANIGALLLARAEKRRHEISVRFSLGGSRATIVVQLLIEALLLALAGAALGLVVASAAANVFRALAPNLPRVGEIRLDTRIVLYSLVCSVVATLLCGLLPAIRGTRGNLSNWLAQTGRTQVSGRSSLQWLLVGVQVALSVTLLTGAGLLLRSFQALGHVSPGFNPSHVLTFHISGSWGETKDMKGLRQRIERIIDSLSAVPGVETAATAGDLPGVPAKYQTELKLLEGPQDPNRKIVVESRFASPSYFATMQIPLLSGELCREDPDAMEVLVNRSFADTYMAGSAVIGHHVQVADSQFPLVGGIQGIVGDAREEGMDHEAVPTVYWCSSAPTPSPFYLVRTAAEPMAMAETVRQKLHEVEPDRSMFDVAPLEGRLDDAFGENRLRAILLGFFAATAVSLAGLGLYGTLSYFVQVRRREVGLRLALGSLRGQIVQRFALQGLGVSFLGCVAGLGLATAFARALSGMLYGVSPTDLVTLSTAILIVLVVSAVASLVPAIRASRVEPMQVLREE